MNINTTNTSPAPAPRRLALLLTAAALFLQGCTTGRTAWSHPADTNSLHGNALERVEPREAIPLVSFTF